MIKEDSTEIVLKPIGIIRTPYRGNYAPYQPLEREEGEARLILKPEYHSALADLEKFQYIYVIYYCHLIEESWQARICPAWAKGKEVGLFASRSPVRPNPIGLSVVKIKRIEAGEVVTNLIDAYDGTPLLDIKPYIKELDSKQDANYGWIMEVDGYDHLLLHIRGIAHKD